MAFASLTVDLTAKMAKFEDSMNNATRSVDKLNARTGALSSGLKAAFSGAAILGIAAFAKSGIDAADAMAKLSARTGVTVKDLASLQLSAEQADTSLDDVGKALLRLKVSQGDAATGNKALGESLARLGITAKDPKEQLYQLADAVKNGGKSSVVASDLNKVLGRSYANLLPYLQQGGDSLRKSAKASESYSDAMARLAPNAEKFNDDLTELKIKSAGAAASLLTRLVPSLAETSTSVNELLNGDHGVLALGRALAGIGKLPFDIIFGDIKIADTAKDRIKELKDELNGLQSDLKSAQNGGGKSSKLMRSIFGTPEEIQQQITVIQNQIAVLEKLGDKIYKPKGSGGAVATTPVVNITDKTKKAPDLESMRAADIADAWKAADDELKQYADDRDFILQGDLERDNAVNAIRLDWIEAGRAMQESMKTPLEQFEQRLEYINELWRRGVIDVETYDRAYAAAFDEGNAKVEKAKSLADELGMTFTSAFEDAIVGGKGLSDVLKGLENDIIRIVMRKAVTEPLANATSSMMSNFMGTIFSAKGNVFTGSTGLSAYSNSVVTQPTAFAFAKGIGIMGEKPGSPGEAIMPLSRMSGGDLGVKVSGGGSMVVNIIESSGNGGKTDQRQDSNGVNVLDVYVEQIKGSIAGDISTGRGSIPSAMSATYGLNRVAGAY